jgi:hypothetical protein
MNGRIPRHFVPDLRLLCASGLSLDQALANLRAKGASIIECIVAVKEHTGCELVEAKQTVHSSNAWHDMAQATEKMWDEMIKVVEEDLPNPH